MLQQLQKSKQKGFTIIEILIVLAIAGLILLVVFLAVPALQRNSRNTQRKNDVSALLGGVSEYISNNGGQLPSSVSQVTDLAKVGYYTGSSDVALSTAASQSALSGDTVRIVLGAKCTLSNGVATGATQAGSSRQYAAQYMIEASNGLQATCQDS